MFWNRKSGHFPFLERPFPVFCVLLGKWFCPWTSRDRGVCPGTKGHRDKKMFLSRDKGTTGRPLETLVSMNQEFKILFLIWIHFYALTWRKKYTFKLGTIVFNFQHDLFVQSVLCHWTNTKLFWAKSFEVRRRFSGYDSMRQIHGTIGSKIMNFRQIKKALQRPGMAHRLVDRCVLRHISKMNFQSWAVLGSRVCREKNPNCQMYATFEAIFYVFMAKMKLH